MVLKWTRTKPEPLKYFEQELNLNPNRYLKRFDTLIACDLWFASSPITNPGNACDRYQTLCFKQQQYAS